MPETLEKTAENVPVEAAHVPSAEKHPRTLEKTSADALPYDLNLEKSVLSAILLDPSNLNIALAVVGTHAGSEKNQDKKKKAPNNTDNQFFGTVARTMFREPVHAVIYEAILSLNANNVTVDVLTVSDWLRRNLRLDSIGGEETIFELQHYAVSTANLENWCHMLKDYAMLREMMKACSGALDLCHAGTGNIKELFDNVESSVLEVRNNFIQPEVRQLKDIIRDTFIGLMKIVNKEVEPGIPTGFPDLDRLLGGGLKPGEMFVLAARPSIGKTALALNIIRNIILKEAVTEDGKRKRVAFFSLEMNDNQIVQRLLCTEARVPLSSFSDGSFQNSDTKRLMTAVSTLRHADLFIDSTSAISLFELRAKARRLKETEGIDLIAIDYLQLMKAGDRSESRQVEVATISGGLKAIAKELNVPVLVLAQLNRETEQSQGGGKNANANPFPKLSNLRESGAIEQDADVVCFLHRNRDEAKEGASSAEGTDAWLIVEKNRNGKTGIVKVRFVPHLMEFQSVEHQISREDIPQKPAPPAGK